MTADGRSRSAGTCSPSRRSASWSSARSPRSWSSVDRTARSKASCTCTTCGARRWSSDGPPACHAPSAEELHARARRLRLLLLDVDGVLTDGTVSIALGRRRVEGVLHSRRRGHRLGPARGPRGRAAERPPVGGHDAAGGRTRHHASCRRAGPTSGAAIAEILAAHGYADERGGLHGRRPAGPAGARRASACRRRRPTRSTEVRARVHWVSRVSPAAAAPCASSSSSCCGRAGQVGRARRSHFSAD